MMTAQDIIAKLGMQRHPEGGWYAETFRDEVATGGRPSSTAIYYLLENGDRSHWHRVDAVEVWHYYAGAPLKLRLSKGKGCEEYTLGVDLGAGQRPQLIVPRDWWQSAETLGDYTLVGCTVAPGFQFEGFEMAPDDWTPPPA